MQWCWCVVVQDPKLAEHLARWGIDVLKVEKTDKTMAELEVCCVLEVFSGVVAHGGEINVDRS